MEVKKGFIPYIFGVLFFFTPHIPIPTGNALEWAVTHF